MSASEGRRQAAARAIRALLGRVRCRPGKDQEHLAKRIAMGHMAPDSTVEDFNALIRDVLGQGTSVVYCYPFAGVDYYG